MRKVDEQGQVMNLRHMGIIYQVIILFWVFLLHSKKLIDVIGLYPRRLFIDKMEYNYTS